MKILKRIRNKYNVWKFNQKCKTHTMVNDWPNLEMISDNEMSVPIIWIKKI